MRPSRTAAVAVVALACAIYSLAVAATAVLDLGVTVDEAAGVVEAVDPNGLAWEYGVRLGDRVVSTRTSDQPGGYALTVLDAWAQVGARARGPEIRLRLATPLALAAIVAALAGFLLSARRRGPAGAVLAVAFALAALPLYLADASGPSAAVVLLGVVAPPMAALSAFPRRRRLVAGWLATAVVVAAVWTTLRLAHAWSPLPVGAAAAALTIGGGAAMASVAAGMTRQRLLRLASMTQVLDVAMFAVAAVLGVSLTTLQVPLPATAVVSLLPLAIYAPARRGIAALADRLVLADMRERESIRATEEERARIARDIHDDPLQAIAGVIRSLDDPAADRSEARESLREVATRLRTVATDLRPPVLDDLGLVPAIDGACRRAVGVEATAAIENASGYGVAGRPPAEVELAAFRIVQEALANAAKHAPGSRVYVAGRVAQGAISLDVADDGPGMPGPRAGAALAEGRLGIPSMRRRAEAIGGELTIESGPGGTTVRLRWQA
jgi:signal transduction histidine kinase